MGYGWFWMGTFQIQPESQEIILTNFCRVLFNEFDGRCFKYDMWTLEGFSMTNTSTIFLRLWLPTNLLDGPPPSPWPKNCSLLKTLA